MTVDNTKARICEHIDQLKDSSVRLSHRIHETPEYLFEEYQAAEWLTNQLDQEGFTVSKGVANLPTAFRADYRGGDGPTIAFLAEFDALPGLGHGCGHNLICSASLTAAIAFKRAWPHFPGTISVMGTPAEEGGGGKILMLERGIFQDIDMSMMFHPGTSTEVNYPSLSAANVDLTFHGRSSHSSLSPHTGINAADAAMLFFAGINAYRQHIPDTVRLHGFIQEAGTKPNIVPALSRVQFMARAPHLETLESIYDQVLNIANGAALMTGTTLDTDRGLTYYDYRHSATLGTLATQNFNRLGISPDPITPGQPRPSADSGNISHAIPHLNLMVPISADTIPGHSEAFRDAAASKTGEEALVTAAKVMGQTAVDVFSDTELLATARDEQAHAISTSPST